MAWTDTRELARWFGPGDPPTYARVRLPWSWDDLKKPAIIRPELFYAPASR